MNITRIKDLLSKIWKKILQHKILSVFLAVVILGGGYYAYGKLNSGSTGTQYVLATVEKGTLVSSVSGSGQVSALNQVDIKPKASGDIIYVGVKNGQWVNAGTLIAKIDDSDAQKAIRDAQANLESAKLSFEKLKQSSADLAKITEDAFNDVSNAFLDFPTIISDSDTILLGSTINPPNQSNIGFYQDFINVSDTANQDKMRLFITAAKNDYADARAKYDQTFLIYKETSRYSGTQTVTALLDKTVEFNKSLAQALKSEKNILDFIADYASNNSKSVPSLVNSYKTTLGTDIGKTNNFLSALISTQNALKNAPLDIRSQELTLKQRENALLDAKEKLADYYVRAPFDGLITKLTAKKGDSASSGTTLATIITRQKIAEISLNEVDVAKVTVGQKVTLTFDAVPELSITGEVADIDAIGTVAQGVVTYNVKITFDTQDDRVKSGMSVSTAIITDVKQDVLLAPNAAVKSKGNSYYVEVVNSSEDLAQTPTKQSVEVGLSNDTATEIISGLKEGDKIVIQTIIANTSSTQTKSQSNTGLRIPGMGR